MEDQQSDNSQIIQEEHHKNTHVVLMISVIITLLIVAGLSIYLFSGNEGSSDINPSAYRQERSEDQNVGLSGYSILNTDEEDELDAIDLGNIEEDFVEIEKDIEQL